MYIQIFGPSCSGKTTLATQLLQTENASAFVEPTGESRYYPLFLQDKPRYAFKNQVDFMRISFKKELAIAHSNAKLIVQDAGLLVCHLVYSRYFRDAGYLTQTEYEALEKIYSRKINRCPLPDAAIFLTAPLAVLEARAFKRDHRIIHNFSEVLPYWDGLTEIIRDMKISLVVMDTGALESSEITSRVKEWLEILAKQNHS